MSSPPMSEGISSRQQQILTLLLQNKAGLSIDEISAALGISRNAVQQHLSKLERDDLVEMGVLNKTAGRPVRSFVLTEAGFNSFPKQYAWFSELVLTNLKEEMGSEVFQQYVQTLARSLSKNLSPKFEGKEIKERLAELVKIMNDLGFQATVVEESVNQDQTIKAFNCIYHDIAQKHEEICEFDRTLITTLLGKKIDHYECMAKGGAACCFRIRKEDQNPK